MNTLILITVLGLGLSESIETRLPADPAMIYTVSFDYQGVKVGLDWKDRSLVTNRVCRKTAVEGKLACQEAALAWLQAECQYYAAKTDLTAKQADMQEAVCMGAHELTQLISARQIAER